MHQVLLCGVLTAMRLSSTGIIQLKTHSIILRLYFAEAVEGGSTFSAECFPW